MRTLCILPKNPLPPDNGGRQRMIELLRALESLGGIDLVIAAALTRAEIDALQALFIGARVHAAPVDRHRLGKVRWLTHRDLPLGLGLLEPTSARLGVTRFVAGASEPYDAVWCAGAAMMYLFGKVVRGVPSSIDFADVTWVLHDRIDRLAAGRPDRWSTRVMKTRTRAKTEVMRWEGFERAQATRASFVTVCSGADREALGVPGAVVVPNGYRRPPVPLGRVEVADPPVLLLAGQMTYRPNVDGATWFAREILPLVAGRIEGATLAIVGRPSPEVEALAARAGVEVRGYADRIEDELARADVVVVPLRQGSGTRIKILEAFAHRLPVVSTTVGAEGLDVRDGVELLLADDPQAFADALVRILTRADLRAALTDAAHRRFAEQFDWEVILSAFAARFGEVARSATRYEVLLGDRASRADTFLVPRGPR